MSDKLLTGHIVGNHMSQLIYRRKQTPVFLLRIHLSGGLTLKVPITTAVDNISDNFLHFMENKA